MFGCDSGGGGDGGGGKDIGTSGLVEKIIMATTLMSLSYKLSMNSKILSLSPVEVR